MEEEKIVKKHHRKPNRHHHHSGSQEKSDFKPQTANKPQQDIPAVSGAQNNKKPQSQNGGNGENGAKKAPQGNTNQSQKQFNPRNKKRRHNNSHHKKPNNPNEQPREKFSADPAVSEEISAADVLEVASLEMAEITEAVESEPTVAVEAPQKSPVKVEVVGVRFKASGKTYYFSPEGLKVSKGDSAIVETARGLELGEVSLANTLVSESDIVPPLRPVVRIATAEDKARHQLNKEKEKEAFVLCNERIVAHNLDMKLIDAQYTFDNSKLLFYFSSSGRVDFRDLVKDLASVFRTRIELRQIGIRDEAKLIGGLGLCGRPLCCAVFLSDFGQVSIKMAKEQNLSLNSAKISGACGRLMCCLRYEHETYEYEIRRTPPVDSTVKTEDGIGVVTEISPLAGTVKVKLTDKPDIPPKSYHRDNVTVIKNNS